MLPGNLSPVHHNPRSLHQLTAMAGMDEFACMAMLVCGAAMWLSEAWPLPVLLVAMALAIAIVSPAGSFWATCAAVPLIYHPVSIGSARVSLLELGLVVTLMGVAARTLMDDPMSRLKEWVEDPHDQWVWLGAAFLIVAGAISLAFQPGHDHIREGLRVYRWVVFEAIAAFVAARHVIRKRGSGSVIAALALPAVVVSAVALVDVVWSPGGFQADGVTRATATYLHPNNLALYLVRVLVLVVGMLALSRTSLSRLWTGAALVIGLGLVATFSRGAVLGLAAGLVVIAWFARRRKVVLAVGGALVMVTVGFAVVAYDRLLGSDTSGVIDARMHIWNSSISMIKDYPISGIGMDQFLYQHAPRYIDPEAWPERYVSHPHNVVLDAWLSLGLAGLLLLAAGLVAAALRSRTLRGEIGPTETFSAAAIAALAAGFAHGFVDNAYFLPDLAVLTWILIALAMSPAAIRETSPVTAISDRTAMASSP